MRDAEGIGFGKHSTRSGGLGRGGGSGRGNFSTVKIDEKPGRCQDIE